MVRIHSHYGYASSNDYEKQYWNEMVKENL